MKISDIKQYTSWGGYCVDVSLSNIYESLERYKNDYHLQMEPEFQRGHVWNQKQQTAYIEHLLKGGRAPEILFNCPEFNRYADKRPMVLVDGLQRITAILKFLDNKLPVFGNNYYNDIEKIDLACRKTYIKFRVNDLLSDREVLQWYIDLNTGCTPHTEEEINRVRELLNKCEK